VGVVIAFINLLNISRSIRNLSPVESIGNYIKGIVSIYERNKSFEKWFGIILFSIGLLVPFSFFPNKMERMGWQGALFDTMIMIAINLAFFFLAVKLGLFKNRHKERLEQELVEWNNLRDLANRIEENPNDLL
jgi:ATP/ADP translocase